MLPWVMKQSWLDAWCWIWRLFGVGLSSCNINVAGALGLVTDLHYDVVVFLLSS